MQNQKHQLVDMSTGELVPAITWIRRVWKGEPFIMMFQEALIEIAKDKTLTGETKTIFMYLLGKLDFENYILMPQTEIAKELDLKKQNVYRAMKNLIAKGIILEGPKVERSRGYRINYNIVWKGNLKNLRVLRNKIEKEEASTSNNLD